MQDLTSNEPDEAIFKASACISTQIVIEGEGQKFFPHLVVNSLSFLGIPIIFFGHSCSVLLTLCRMMPFHGHFGSQTNQGFACH